ncbi:hypothetical protein JR311_01760 [Bacillus velezensis]|uniref:hypothetical protein n=1 Tax=Bacillus velezensis TaxID=492670 RepID=UPI00100A02A6|nr:hypothetical protein [Bacillus velezensis]MEC1940144.1 hypothetical protein [Bacillus velezensis]MEC2196336.1 hypothetical protein [Bacillus velezensis]QAW48426.1 hypothetical protein ETK69_01045 [Bacillus velezensis]QRV09696.1 hypothetical protein JR311_01760 [Bacillus velezensis]WFO91404.1 hypothetical protein JEQ23_01045 [Bacillus velezensis]
MSGWVKLYKSVVDHEIFTDNVGFRLFTFLMAKAAYQDGMKINDYELKKGQYIRSYSKLCDDLAVKKGRGLTRFTRAAIKAAAERLQAKGMIAAEETEYGMLWTIVNYSKFQGSERIVNEESFSERRQISQPIDEKLTPFQKIEEKYLSRKGGMFTTPYDVAAINRILDQKIPIEDVLAWIDEIFDRYVPKHRADGIKSFTYCEQGILDRWHAKQNPPPKTNVSEFRPRGSKQEESFAALEAYAKENGISMG